MTGLAPPLARERSLQPVQSRGEDPGGRERFQDAEPSRPSKRSGLRTLTKETEWRTRAGGKAGQAEEGGAGGRAGARPRRAWRRPRRLGQCRPGRAAEGSGQPGPPGQAGERSLRRRRTDRGCGPRRTRVRPAARRRPQPSPGPALIQAAFPSPYRQPHAVGPAPDCRGSCPHTVPRGSRSQPQPLRRQRAEMGGKGAPVTSAPPG